MLTRMFPRRFAAPALICAAGFLATPALAETLLTPAEMPPAGYDQTTWVDSRGCTFFKASNGQWVGAVVEDNHTQKPVCGPKPSLGTVSPLTGYPVPEGYRVVWTDGRLNPLRGPLSDQPGQ